MKIYLLFFLAVSLPATGVLSQTSFFIPFRAGAVSGAQPVASVAYQRDGNMATAFSLHSFEEPALIRGPYLQVATPSSIHIRWRTNGPSQSRVRYGPDAANLDQIQESADFATEHEIVLSGLSPRKKYWYSIGSFTAQLQGDASNYFITLPQPGTKDLLRIGVIGDCGNNSPNQIGVRDQLQNYLGGNYMDAWILLGDNAYDGGTDAEFQAGFFNIYKDAFLKQNPLFPAPGNHDYNNNATAQNDHAVPYYSVFSVPTHAEAGGLPSGNPAYYSFNMGNIHFLSLDSYGQEDNSTRLYDTLGRQVQWIKADLENNRNKDWVIAYWHHPPFTKGSHDSDTEDELVSMRTSFIAILERYGVDLVLCGHSHDYERTRLQKGHYGAAATFDPSIHNLSTSSGLYDGSSDACPYLKGAANGNQGTVYVVAGSAGQLGGMVTGVPHNAMYYSNATTGGSLVLEVQGNRLDARWICSDGVIRDRFTMMKDVNIRKTVSINQGQSALLTASFTGSYRWLPAGQTTQSVTVAPTAAGTYTYMVKDAYNCISDTFTVVVAPVASLPARWGTVQGWYDASSKAINLKWQTLQEAGTDHFEIERSGDGAAFTALGKMPAAINSNQIHQYGFSDNAPDHSKPVQMYRIRQVGKDGNSGYSSIISISLVHSTAQFDVQVVPNPGTSSEIKIRLMNKASTAAIIRLTDNTGKTVVRKQLLLTGLLQPFIPSVKKGIYILTVEADGGMVTRRVVIR